MRADSAIPRLIRSGWWVAVAAAVLAAFVLVLGLASGKRSQRASARSGGRSVAGHGFDLSNCLVSTDRIVASGMPRDGLHVLNQPDTVDADQVTALNAQGRGKFLVPDDRVIGVAVGGAARAYPLRLLRWHELVNDTIGGLPVAVTYNPLCDSAVVMSRRSGDRVIELGVSGLLLNSNLLLYDSDGSSLWSQLQARAVAGPAAGDTLDLLPCDLCTWRSWSDRHPDTGVLAPVAELKSLYKRDPYHSYFGSDLLRFPVDPLPPPTELHLKDRVVAVRVGGEERVFALPRLAAAAGAPAGIWETTVGGVPVRLHFSTSEPSVSVELPEGVSGAAVRHAFWFAWYAAYPDAPEPGPLPAA